MLPHAFNSLITLLVTTCYAQTSPTSFREHIANLILVEQSTIDFDSECGSYYDDATSAAIALRIFSNYTPNICYNLDTIYSSENYVNDSLATANEEGEIVSSCDPFFVNCTSDFQAVGIDNYSSSSNYSQTQVDIYYDAISRPNLSNFTLKVFAKSDCKENTADPWNSWGGCEESELTHYCRELQYSVRSFRLQQTAPDSIGECRIAAKRGNGARTTKASLAAIIVGLFIVSITAAL